MDEPHLCIGMIAAGGHAVAEIAEIVGRDDVVGADHRAAGLVVLNARRPQARRPIDHGEIGADFVEQAAEKVVNSAATCARTAPRGCPAQSRA
jgi:hypothetical protein